MSFGVMLLGFMPFGGMSFRSVSLPIQAVENSDLWKSTLQLSLGQFWLMKHIFKIELVFTNSLDPNHHRIPFEQLLDQRLDPYPYITQTDQKHILKENRYKIFTLGGKTRQSFATFFLNSVHGCFVLITSKPRAYLRESLLVPTFIGFCD